MISIDIYNNSQLLLEQKYSKGIVLLKFLIILCFIFGLIIIFYPYEKILKDYEIIRKEDSNVTLYFDDTKTYQNYIKITVDGKKVSFSKNKGKINLNINKDFKEIKVYIKTTLFLEWKEFLFNGKNQ